MSSRSSESNRSSAVGAQSATRGVKNSLWTSVGAWFAQRLGHVHMDEANEREFRNWYTMYARTSVRASIWLPLLAVTLAACGGGYFADLRDEWFAEQHASIVDIVRFGLVLPWALVVSMIVYTPLYARWYAPVVKVFAPLHGIAIVIFDALARSQEHSLGSWMVLTVLSPYFMYGLLLRDAMRSVVIVLATYLAVHLLMHTVTMQWVVDCLALLLGFVFGGYVCYSLHQSVRNSYLDRQRLSERAHRDPLTGIHNRRLFDGQLTRLWSQALRDGATLGLLIVDIDHFKTYNDSLGHQAGDECLTIIARILAAGARRPLDVAARYGGEEFAILLYATDRRAMEDLAEQLRVQVMAAQLPHPASPVNACVTVSIGAACVVPQPGRSPVGFVQLADEALYAAKDRGRNRIVLMEREYDSLKTGVFRSYKPRKEAVA